jgi:rhodanese-related sulfurtransferase
VVSRTLEQLLADAREMIERLTPNQAFSAMKEGAPMIDIRAEMPRERLGVIPGSIHVPRTVLEWRVAPDSRWRNPHIDHRERLILVCDHGYSSSLAAASLVELGCHAADVIGGFDAWVDKNLPIIRVTQLPDPLGIPGMGAPEPR